MSMDCSIRITDCHRYPITMTICCIIFVGLDFIFECRILKVDRNIVDEKNNKLVIVL